jgi:hypothetical protein
LRAMREKGRLVMLATIGLSYTGVDVVKAY